MRSKAQSDQDLRSSERLRLELWPTARLIPSPRNARTHSDAQVAEIAGSIRAFGFTNPINRRPSSGVLSNYIEQ
jgi:ParB-like chromosome segregation protein Spo0J